MTSVNFAKGFAQFYCFQRAKFYPITKQDISKCCEINDFSMINESADQLLINALDLYSQCDNSLSPLPQPELLDRGVQTGPKKTKTKLLIRHFEDLHAKQIRIKTSKVTFSQRLYRRISRSLGNFFPFSRKHF